MKRKKKEEAHTDGFFNSEVFLRKWLSCGIHCRAGCSVLRRGQRVAHGVWWLLVSIYHPRQLRTTLRPQITL